MNSKNDGVKKYYTAMMHDCFQQANIHYNQKQEEIEDKGVLYARLLKIFKGYSLDNLEKYAEEINNTEELSICQKHNVLNLISTAYYARDLFIAEKVVNELKNQSPKASKLELEFGYSKDYLEEIKEDYDYYLDMHENKCKDAYLKFAFDFEKTMNTQVQDEDDCVIIK